MNKLEIIGKQQIEIEKFKQFFEEIKDEKKDVYDNYPNIRHRRIGIRKNIICDM